MIHTPLSKDLEELVARSDGGAGTLNALMEKTEARGIYLVVILLCLPFISPIPVPGLSNVFGVVIMIVGWRMILREPQRLPRFLGDRPISARTFQKVVSMSVRFLQILEKVVKPRGALWMHSHWGRVVNASFLIFMAFLLALPIPPVVPFSNSMPAYAIIIMCAAMMEADGRAVWLAYGVGVATVVYLMTAAAVIKQIFLASWDYVAALLQKAF